jgi:ATP-binding cassette subfamily B protein
MVLHHTLSIGALVAFFLYLNRFFQPIQLLVQQYNTYQQGQASVNKLRDLVDTEVTVPEAPTAIALPPIEGEIVFEQVSFAYDPGPPVIEDVNLTVAPGETVAFVGPTGAGKSTLAKLVTRFYDVASSGWCPRSPSCSPGPSGTTSPSPGRPRPTNRSTRRWTGWGSPM